MCPRPQCVETERVRGSQWWPPLLPCTANPLMTPYFCRVSQPAPSLRPPIQRLCRVCHMIGCEQHARRCPCHCLFSQMRAFAVVSTSPRVCSALPLPPSNLLGSMARMHLMHSASFTTMHLRMGPPPIDVHVAPLQGLPYDYPAQPSQQHPPLPSASCGPRWGMSVFASVSLSDSTSVQIIRF